MKYSVPKGTFDILPVDPSPNGLWRESHLWRFLEEKIHELAHEYGYREIRTPIFEETDLFTRSVGETSDIVTKEMYNFVDKGNRNITLRPELTAAAMRAVIENRLDQQPRGRKLYYIGPMFRYERPQAGRYRQHHQFGIEAIGDPSAEQDAEAIDLLCELYRRLGLKNLTVMINSVGDLQSRDNYRVALKNFLLPQLEKLSSDSKVRFEKNPLRILDSKNPEDQNCLIGAPSILEYLSPEPKDHFEKLQKILKQIGIPFVVNDKLVRGLDYYNKTVFEITSGELGAQNTIGAGGRYDGLAKSLGGPDIPAVGFATGLERVIHTMLGQNIDVPKPPGPQVFLIPVGQEAENYCLKLLFNLRHQRVAAEMEWHSIKIAKALKRAETLGATYALIIGDEELNSKQIRLKHLESHEEISLALHALANFFLSEQN